MNPMKIDFVIKIYYKNKFFYNETYDKGIRAAKTIAQKVDWTYMRYLGQLILRFRKVLLVCVFLETVRDAAGN
jgi:hypothetical protein